MTSDVFFIVSSVCIVIITILLSFLLLKLINTLDEAREVVLKTKNVTANAGKALATVATLGGILSPTLGVTNKIFGKKSKKNSE